MAKVYAYVQQVNGAEDDVLLVGDFNGEPDDKVAYANLMALPSMTHLFKLPNKSHIRDSSLYDNIFFQTQYVTEYLSSSDIDKFDEKDFGNNDKAANLAVSDHRPVWAVFSLKVDDDGSDASGNASIVVEASEAENSESRASEDMTVYVTRTGKKYHRGSCSFFKT